MMLAILTFAELNFFITAQTVGLVALIVLSLIYFFITRTEFDREWEKDQINQKPMFDHIKKRFKVYGKLTCGKIDGVQWFIYKNGEYIGVYDTETDTLTK